jgi:phage gp46-like protein
MVDISIRPDPACPENGLYGWDSVYSNTTCAADWAFAGSDEKSNKGGLSNRAALATAVTIALFTDRACPPDHPLAKFADGDPRGWWGDGLLLDGEVHMGSLLWLLERSVVTEENRRWAEAFALEAIEPLGRAGAYAKATAEATISPGGNGIWLVVSLYGRDGSKVYDRKFDVAWQQVGAETVGGGA